MVCVCWWWICGVVLHLQCVKGATRIISGDIQSNNLSGDRFEMEFALDSPLGASQTVSIDYFRDGCNELLFTPPQGSDAAVALSNLLQAADNGVAVMSTGSTTTTLLHSVSDVKQVVSLNLSVEFNGIPFLTAQYCVRMSLCNSQDCIANPSDLIDILELLPSYRGRLRGMYAMIKHNIWIQSINLTMLLAESYLCDADTGASVDDPVVKQGQEVSICVRTDEFPTISVDSIGEFILTAGD